MKKLKLFAVLFVSVATFFPGSVLAQQTVHGSNVLKKTKQLVQEVTWWDNLDDLKAQAKQQNRMIYWLQVVGDLDAGL